ncbi:hypothetical protein [Ralstonia sp. ASV6]|nr:hypothetical protein [Ralstonia sp. ASV6]
MEGALQGAAASDAYSMDVGLRTTMSAEFIVMTFQQQMTTT